MTNQINNYPVQLVNQLNNWVDRVESDEAVRRIFEACVSTSYHLDLSQLHLRSLPNIFDLLPELGSLNLSKNKLEFLPETINTQFLIQELDLSHNRLTQFNGILPQIVIN